MPFHANSCQEYCKCFFFYATNFFSQLFNSEGNYGITYRIMEQILRQQDTTTMINNYKDSLVPHQLKVTELVT